MLVQVGLESSAVWSSNLLETREFTLPRGVHDTLLAVISRHGRDTALTRACQRRRARKGDMWHNVPSIRAGYQDTSGTGAKYPPCLHRASESCKFANSSRCIRVIIPGDRSTSLSLSLSLSLCASHSSVRNSFIDPKVKTTYLWEDKE